MGNKLVKWFELVAGVLHIQLDDQQDMFVWGPGKDFSVKSLYNNLVRGAGVPAKCLGK
jgi:hypothetical protein